MSKDPYAILGVARTASDDEIKKAYRALVKDLHPDLNPNDEAKANRFKEVSAAFEILGDKNKRARYDRGEIDGAGNPRGFAGGHSGGHPGAHPGGQAGGFGRGGFGGGGFGGFGGESEDPFDDLLSGLFGGRGGRRRTGPVKGRDVRYSVEIPFRDAVTGARRRMTMADGKALDIDIPAGIQSGQTLRLRSQGQPSPGGGPPGDALIEVRVADSPVWTREGDNLRMTKAVSLDTAVLGGKVDVETPNGKLSLKVPAGSNTGSVLRLKGQGVQRPSKPGDLYVRLEIVLDDPRDSRLQDFLKSAAAK